MASNFLVHEPGDAVGVAVAEIPSGVVAEGRVLSDNTSLSISTRDAIPFGHKIALRDIAQGDTVLEYGQPIGEAIIPIPAGAYVHTHNLRSIRWCRSVVDSAPVSSAMVQ
jgi:(2R)-sulfolactate sulfo-lyase subunit alpha